MHLGDLTPTTTKTTKHTLGPRRKGYPTAVAHDYLFRCYVYHTHTTAEVVQNHDSTEGRVGPPKAYRLFALQG